MSILLHNYHSVAQVPSEGQKYIKRDTETSSTDLRLGDFIIGDISILFCPWYSLSCVLFYQRDSLIGADFQGVLP